MNDTEYYINDIGALCGHNKKGSYETIYGVKLQSTIQEAYKDFLYRKDIELELERANIARAENRILAIKKDIAAAVDKIDILTK